jgi:hypothetical protein
MAILLFHLLFLAYIITIIAIITLLFTLLLTQTFMNTIFFEKYYFNYRFPSLLLELLQLFTIISNYGFIGGQRDVNFSQSLHRFTLVYS